VKVLKPGKHEPIYITGMDAKRRQDVKKRQKGGAIMSIKIDEYLNSISALAAASVQSTTAAQESTQTQKEDCDSYIPSGADANAVLPSDNYNDILKIMQSAGTEETGTGTSSGAQTSAGESGSVSGSAAAGGGAGGSEEEDETTTEVVTVNGVTYLETTTTTDGVTTVTRTVIGKE
jgi:hypothetical protein